jgi:hypothetical protein
MASAASSLPDLSSSAADCMVPEYIMNLTVTGCVWPMRHARRLAWRRVKTEYPGWTKQASVQGQRSGPTSTSRRSIWKQPGRHVLGGHEGRLIK